MSLEYVYFDVDDPTKDRVTIQLWDGEELRGAIFLRKASLLPDDPNPYTPCWQVAGIDVLEPFRRKGYGTKLYEEAARQADRYGMNLCSDVPESLDPKAAAFWEKQVQKGRAFWEVPGPEEEEGANYDYGRFVLKRSLAPSLSGPGSSDSVPVALAKRAAIHLYQTDSEFVVGGCSDVSEVISAWLQKKGYDAKPVYGAARYGKKEWFLHAWIEIEGTLFDPVLWVQNRKMEKYSYAPEPDAALALRCDVETILEGEVEALDRAIT